VELTPSNGFAQHLSTGAVFSMTQEQLQRHQLQLNMGMFQQGGIPLFFLSNPQGLLLSTSEGNGVVDREIKQESASQ
jgi:hypothetical protein